MRHRGVREAEFEEFYAATRDACLRAAVGSGVRRESAEEAVAEAYARAWASWTRVRGLRSPTAWVVRVAVNSDVSRWRRRRREVLADASPPAGVDRLPEVDLLDAVAALPARQREVVAMRYLLDLDTAATAAWLGIAPGTVKAHLHQALAALRLLLDREDCLP